MFFENFPQIFYNFNINGVNELRILKDISLNIRVRKDVLDNVTLYDDYDIQDGDTVDKIAARVYGNSLYHWVIMLVNQKFDYINDFPMSSAILEEYVALKYGADNRDSQHRLFGELHYELPNGNVVDSGIPNAVAISNYEYEFSENEKKRRIKLINPGLIDQVVKELETAFTAVNL